MRAVVLSTVLLLFAQTLAVAADPVAEWKGVKVLPKLDAVVKAGKETIDHKGFTLPWTVHDVKGDWLWVGEQRKGWVLRSQVVTLDEAPAYYSQLIKNGQEKVTAYICRATAWYEKGDLDLAIADDDEALRLQPSARTYSNRGTIWAKKKNYDKAIADYSQAIRLDPSYATAYYNRGACWGDKQDYDKSIDDYNRAIALDPTHAASYYNRGVSWMRKKDDVKAIADFNETIRLEPNLALAYYNRGNAWCSKSEFDKALDDYTQAIRLDPNYAGTAYNSRGSVRMVKHEYDKAIDDYDQAIRLDPNYAVAYFNRGMAWKQKSYYDNAIADYNQAIRLDPKNLGALNSAAWLMATCVDQWIRNGKKAIELATKACELSGQTDANCLGTLAAAYAEAGDFDSAIQCQNKALALNPTDADFVRKAKDRLVLFKDHKPYREE